MRPLPAGPPAVDPQAGVVDLERHRARREKHESATFRLSVSRTVGEGADFVDIVCFDQLAAVCAEWLAKGREVAVVGKLRLSESTGPHGERRSKIQVVADAVQFLGKPTKVGDPDGAVEPGTKPADRPAPGKYRKAS